MPEDNRDMLMMFKIAANKYVSGEAQSQIDYKNDSLASDFAAGNFFEVKDFKFGINQIDPGDAGSGSAPKLTEEHKKAGYKQATDGSIVDKEGKPIPGGTVSSPKFTKFVTGKRKVGYPSDIDPFEFTRFIDIASLTLFQAVTTLQRFPAVSLIKRKSLGMQMSSGQSTSSQVSAETGNSPLRTFMRFDFTDVMLISLDWEEDDVVKETIKFICRAVTVRYFPEKVGGNELDMSKNKDGKSWSFKNTTATPVTT